jgi:vacuolar protein sorting-associated protein 13A/C
MPLTKVTVINDLQGLDEALFRASVANFVAGADVSRYGSPDMTFDFHMNTSILADYFDTSCSIWSRLLVQPWEITLKGFRSQSRRFKSDRLSTTIDLESFPCSISFSEQFLVSLASASRMWSIYAVATAVHMENGASAKSGSLRASMAASAVRNLVMSMPYAIENTSGVNVSFSLLGNDDKQHRCKTGSIQYFRFEPPKGNGFGGRRSYGQDLNFEKVVTVFVDGETKFSINRLDLEGGPQKTAHRMNDGTVLITRVAKEGKTTVSCFHHKPVINSMKKILSKLIFLLLGSSLDKQCRLREQYVIAFPSCS